MESSFVLIYEGQEICKKEMKYLGEDLIAVTECRGAWPIENPWCAISQ
jgi:hypothetical protein